MKKDQNNLDELLRQKMAGEEYEYKEPYWEKASELLDEKLPNRTFWNTGKVVVASVLAGIIIGAAAFFGYETLQSKPAQTAASDHQASPTEQQTIVSDTPADAQKNEAKTTTAPVDKQTTQASRESEADIAKERVEPVQEVVSERKEGKPALAATKGKTPATASRKVEPEKKHSAGVDLRKEENTTVATYPADANDPVQEETAEEKPPQQAAGQAAVIPETGNTTAITGKALEHASMELIGYRSFEARLEQASLSGKQFEQSKAGLPAYYEIGLNAGTQAPVDFKEYRLNYEANLELRRQLGQRFLIGAGVGYQAENMQLDFKNRFIDKVEVPELVEKGNWQYTTETAEVPTFSYQNGVPFYDTVQVTYTDSTYQTYTDTVYRTEHDTSQVTEANAVQVSYITVPVNIYYAWSLGRWDLRAAAGFRTGILNNKQLPSNPEIVEQPEIPEVKGAVETGLTAGYYLLPRLNAEMNVVYRRSVFGYPSANKDRMAVRVGLRWEL